MRVVWVIGLLLTAAAVSAAEEHVRSDAQRRFLAAQRYEDIYYLPPDHMLVLGSLGHRAALADLIWMKSLIYYGEELSHRGDVKNLYRYTDAMLRLDPDFKRVYQWVASSAIYRTGDVGSKDAFAAIRYLEIATRRFPDDGELAWDLGATYAFELPPLLASDVERATARRKGLDYLEAAVLRGKGPPWLALQTAGQLRKLGRTEQAIRHLEDAHATATQPEVRRGIEIELAKLRSASYSEAFRRTNEELEAGRTKDFPYLPPSLYLLVGKRPVRDLQAFMLAGFDPLADVSMARDSLSD